MSRRIKTKPSWAKGRRLVLGGWFHGKRSYLWIGEKNDDGLETGLATIEGAKLYRLARAIVKEYEGAKILKK